MSSPQFVTLKNRTSKTLSGQYDGKTQTFPPGYEGSWPEIIALKFKEQNPVMGTEDFYSGYKSYLMGIVEHGDDLDPIEQNTQAVEMFDPASRGNVMVIKGRGMYHPVQDKGRALPAQLAKVESFEPQAGFDTETIRIVDPVDFKP